MDETDSSDPTDPALVDSSLGGAPVADEVPGARYREAPSDEALCSLMRCSATRGKGWTAPWHRSEASAPVRSARSSHAARARRHRCRTVVQLGFQCKCRGVPPKERTKRFLFDESSLAMHGFVHQPRRVARGPADKTTAIIGGLALAATVDRSTTRRALTHPGLQPLRLGTRSAPVCLQRSRRPAGSPDPKRMTGVDHPIGCIQSVDGVLPPTDFRTLGRLRRTAAASRRLALLGLLFLRLLDMLLDRLGQLNR